MLKSFSLDLNNLDKIIDKIIKDCFWDYNIDRNYIKKIISNNDKREVKKLFSKIIYNSTDVLQALQIFSKDQLKYCLDNFTPTYNKKYINRRILILKFLLLGEKHYIKGLEWEKK